MYILRIFGVYFNLSSDTGPNMFFFLFCFFKERWHFEFVLCGFVFLLTAMGVGKLRLLSF